MIKDEALKMNERIHELAESCMIEKYNQHGNLMIEFGFDYEKFAEMIVRECARVANDSNQSKNRAPGVSVGDVVRKHFGVE